MNTAAAQCLDPDRDAVVEACLHCGRVLSIPGIYPESEAAAWLVVAAGGARSLHLERASADAYAARARGVCKALYLQSPN